MPHLPYKNLLYYTTPQFNFGHGVNWVPNIGKFDHLEAATSPGFFKRHRSTRFKNASV
jgi:hypothetical protein